MLSSSRKKALWIKGHSLKLTQYPYALVAMKDLMKTPLPLAGKKLLPLAGISAKIKENGFNEQEQSFSWKIGLHLISWMVATGRKKIWIKAKGL